MPESDPFRLFITHAWADHDDYHRLFEYLGESTNFFYLNLSDPHAESVPTGNRLEMEQALADQIANAEVVIVLASLWEQEQEMVELQIAVANKHHKPLIGLRASGSQVFPKALEDQVTDVVIWNERTIVDAIMYHSRGEKTNRFEVIDFDFD